MIPVLAMAGCAQTDPIGPDNSETILHEPIRLAFDQNEDPALELTQDPRFGYTYHSSDGNRIVDGSGSLPGAVPFQVQLGFAPVWVVAVAVDNGSLWTAVSTGGDVAALLVREKVIQEVPIKTDGYIPGSPPLMRVDSGGVSLVSAIVASSSDVTHPVVLGVSGATVWIGEDGWLHLQDSEEHLQLDIAALPDARILQDQRGRVLLLSDPTEAYSHGVLGDELEATAVLLAETTPDFRVVKRISVPDGLVIEGIMPIWADMDDDGEREIIVTGSDRDAGARLMVFSEDGNLLAESKAIGQGFRWRHQIAVASSSESAPPELISVKTPHIGGMLEYFQIVDDRLELAAIVSGVTSHVIGTRNLDLALVGDFDGDGFSETLLPDDELRSLVAVERTTDGASIDWSLPLAAIMSSNLAAVTDADDQIIVGTGLADGSLLIWSR